MTTKADKLNGPQLKAVDMLATGATITAAAGAVGVSRQTVSEWVNRDAEFRATLNRRRAELWTEQSDRLRSLIPKALDRLEAALENGTGDGLRAALGVLKLAGVGDLSRIGPTSAQAIANQDFMAEICPSRSRP
ncbi:MAG: helix-turn-helix domain-containing protein [Acidobacteria bacterium]|nr:helix-turn-helix domain-containing protein [Acidobacteriota bacterium]MCW5969425.1 helix-turn-helix domain-containing protein [Blastocatellales bacterium]